MIRNIFVQLYFLLHTWLGFGQSLDFEEVGPLPAEIQECSGLVALGDNALITINDSGNEPILYVLDTLGQLQSEVKLLGIKNVDWEALSLDEGILYIGDFGNNANRRKDLIIYKIDLSRLLSHQEWAYRGAIEFHYPEQRSFPPENEARYYDCEAMVALGDSLYLFTKNRTKPFDGLAQVYALPKASGAYVAKNRGAFQTGLGLMPSYWIGDASLDAAGRLFLLGYDKIWMIDSFAGSLSKKHPHTQYALGALGQREGLCVLNQHLYLGEEKTPVRPARLFKAPLPPLNKLISLDAQQSALEPVEKVFGEALVLKVNQASKVIGLKWELFNQAGKVVADGQFERKDLKDGQIHLDLVKLAKGTYVLNLKYARQPRAFVVLKN